MLGDILLIIYPIGVLGSFWYFSRKYIGERYVSNEQAIKLGRPALSTTPDMLMAILFALVWFVALPMELVEKFDRKHGNKA